MDFGISTILTAFFAWMQASPQLSAGVVGVLLSLAATQVLKYLVPDTWTDYEYKATVRAIGIITGWFFGFGMWKILDPTAKSIVDLFWAVGVGFLSPASYSLLVPWICNKWPFMAKYLSGRPFDGPHS
jgi:hypothetical protein